MSQPKHAEYTFLNITASTTAAAKQLVAASTASMRHRVIGLTAAAVAAQSITLQSSTGGAYMGPINLAAGVPLVLPPSAIGYFETAAGKSIYNQSDNATETVINLIYQSWST